MFGSFFKKIRGDSPQESLRDPVCGMQARGGLPTQAGITHEYKGKVYSFCSEHCKEQFEKNPEAYVTK